jgi:hypothetical protein
VFKWSDAGFGRVLDESTLSIEALLAGIDTRTVFIGEGALLYKDVILRELGDKALFGAPQHMVPSPANTAMLCMKKAVKGEYTDALKAVPAYHRRSEAEIKLG